MKLDCCDDKKASPELQDLVLFLKAISDKNRLRILCILQKGELCVCDIWQDLKLSQNLVSHHLKILKDFALLDSRKEGTKVIYSLNTKTTQLYISLLSKYLK